MIFRCWAGLALLFMSFCHLLCQDEATLRRALEGKEVFVRVDMPATKYGIDVHPEASMPVDFSLVGRRIRQYGVALHRGDRATVTRVKVHPKSIEFQLDGGGYGTFSDLVQEGMSNPLASTYVPKSREQKRLESEYRSSGDTELKERLEDLRERQRRETARLRVQASTARVLQQQQRRNQAATAGSRLNLKFQHGTPARALTPEGLIGLLHNYVDFAGSEGPAQEATAAQFSALHHDRLHLAPNPLDLHKGMSEQEVIDLFGSPHRRSVSEIAGLEWVEVSYRLEDATLSIQYAGAVLVRFSLQTD